MQINEKFVQSINFFVPVVYENQIKTAPQQALETIDEYLYLGDKFRVSIFAPDTEHPQSWAMQNCQDRHRSWTNVAIKVASYCTIILPLVVLLIKAILRCYLQVSSVRVQQRFSPGSRMEARLPDESLRHIASFLSYQDQAQLAQVAIFARNAARDTQQYYIDLTASLKTEIEALPAEPLAFEDFQRLLVELVTSPAAGHPKHWVPLMDALMRHYYLGPDDTINGIIQKHANIADLLATSEQLISSNQIYQFCRYLGRKQLSRIRSWIGYRALEQYSLKLNSPSVNRALEEYLTKKAEKHITIYSNSCHLSNDRILNFKETHIDPREWFGLNQETGSLWRQPGAQNDEIAPMPALLLEVLWAHIQSLRASCIDRPFMVAMTGRLEAQLPNNFTLTLAQRITNADIFLHHNQTINTQEIEKQNYTRGVSSLNDTEMEALATNLYPNALTIQD